MNHIFVIHSLVEGHLDYVQVLAIMNNAAMNIVEQVSFGMIECPLSICPKVVLLKLEIDCLQIFEEPP